VLEMHTVYAGVIYETPSRKEIGCLELPRPFLLHSFLQVHSTSASFTSHGNLCNYADPKPFPEPNRHVLDFRHPISLCRIVY
jgi:hypothetical protein